VKTARLPVKKTLTRAGQLQLSPALAVTDTN
jgi:hypothetical protein